MGNSGGIMSASRNGTVKMLVLGCMGAGKSSFIRQIVKIYGTKNQTMIRNYYVWCVQLNLVNIYRELKNVCTSLEIDWSKYEESFAVIDVWRPKEVMKSEVVVAIRKIRSSGLFDACRKRQRILQLPQNYNYHINNTEQYLAEDYIPSEMDIMMTYSPTIGHNSEEVTVANFRFQMLEMPGHHIWRARWARWFNDTDLVTFIIDMSEVCDPAFYDKGHLQDKTVSVFKNLRENELLKKCFWLLLFNKNDTFNDHAAGFDFKKLANHVDTADNARSFYRGQFTADLDKNKSYVHMVSLVNNAESKTVVSEMFKKVSKYHRDRLMNQLT